MPTQKELLTKVVLHGETTSGFNALAQKITEMGYQINQVSQVVAQWEKESLETYKNYETYMLEAKGAMSATAESSSELEQQYAKLQLKAQEWAGNTIFHTNDVAKAISEAAHAGWTYEEMLQGIPEAMVLAQAGNTDLSTGLDMLIKTLNGTGTAFEDSGSFVNQWVKASNISATTVSELGEAMERMGATMRFADSNAELLTMLAILADTGSTGAQAGTLLRNSMIRLIAPTKAAQETMKGLGITADEVNEAVGADSETLEEVSQILTQAGFSAYTSEGKLKPFLLTFRDLYDAVSGIEDENKRNLALSSIFPTRTITGAMSILEAAADNYDGLLGKILDSEGYAKHVAEIQTSGLMGSEELLKSKWEEFSRKIGEWLSEPMEQLNEWAGGFVDILNGADTTTIGAISGAATAIAAAGPGLIAAGMGMKLFSVIGPWGTAILAAVAGAGALVGYFTELNKLAMENNFGTMALNMEEINTALKGADDKNSGLLKNIHKYSEELQGLQESYEQTGTKLAESLTSKMVAGTKITWADKVRFFAYGTELVEDIQSGILAATNEKIELADLLFSTEDGSENPENNKAYASIVSLLAVGAAGAKEEATRIGQDLRKAMMSAFADGKLTEEELRNIQGLMDELNSLMAGLSPSDIDREKLLIKSQRTSLESMEAFSAEVTAARDEAFSETDEQMLDLQAQLAAYYKWAVEHGQQFIHPETGELVNPSEVDIESLVAGTEAQYTIKKAGWSREYNEILQRGWDNAIASSDVGALFTEAQQYLDLAQRGLMTFGQAESLIVNSDAGGQGILAKSLDTLIEQFGGTEAMATLVGTYRQLGDEGSLAIANWLEQMVTMREALGGQVETPLKDYAPEDRKVVQDISTYLADILDNGVGADDLKAYFDSLTVEQQNSWQSIVNGLNEKFNLAALGMSVMGGQENVGDLNWELLQWLGAYYMSNRAPGNQGAMEDLEDYRWQEGEKTELSSWLYDYALNVANGAIEKQQQIIDNLQTKRTEIDKSLSELQGKYEDESYLKSLTADQQGFLMRQIEELENQKKAADLDITEAENELTTLKEELEEISTHPPIAVKTETELDSSTVDEWKPPSKYAFVYYTPVTSDEEENGGENKSGGENKNSTNSNIPSIFKKFAEGGRTTEPSIFGEAGAEWAIPEEHSERTAELLNAAREASGFTWGELLAAYGGLNAGGNISVNIQSYAPVINASDAAGIAEELEKDKVRLGEVVKKAVQTAMEDMKLSDSIEVYA